MFQLQKSEPPVSNYSHMMIANRFLLHDSTNWNSFIKVLCPEAYCSCLCLVSQCQGSSLVCNTLLLSSVPKASLMMNNFSSIYCSSVVPENVILFAQPYYYSYFGNKSESIRSKALTESREKLFADNRQDCVHLFLQRSSGLGNMSPKTRTLPLLREKNEDLITLELINFFLWNRLLESSHANNRFHTPILLSWLITSSWQQNFFAIFLHGKQYDNHMSRTCQEHYMSPKMPAKVFLRFFMVSSSLWPVSGLSPVSGGAFDELLCLTPETSSAPAWEALRMSPLMCAAVCSICCWIPPAAPDEVSVDPVDVVDPLLWSVDPPAMPLTILGRDPRCLSVCECEWWRRVINE